MWRSELGLLPVSVGLSAQQAAAAGVLWATSRPVCVVWMGMCQFLSPLTQSGVLYSELLTCLPQCVCVCTQVSRAVRDSLTVRAADFGIVLEDIAITHLSFGTEFTKVSFVILP